jgi:hypothetical protein
MHEQDTEFMPGINAGCLNFANDGLMFVIGIMQPFLILLIIQRKQISHETNRK